jgi:hypothetical protein
MKDAVFGGDLSYADLIENFFAWEQQSIAGTEIVDRVSCQILESRPGKGDRSIYGRVLSWIDPKRLVPLRVEKYFESGSRPGGSTPRAWPKMTPIVRLPPA